jgi:hypothetical protein
MFKNFSIKKKILSIGIFSVFSFLMYLTYISVNLTKNKETLNNI